MIRRLSAAALAVFLMSSCAPKTPGVVLDTRVTSASALLDRIRAGGEKFTSMTARGSVSFESPEGSGSVFVSVAMKRPDSLLVRFRGPFGIDGGMFFLSRERFLFYNAFENRVVSGKPEARSLRSIIPFDLTPEEILQAFCGRFPVAAPEDTVRRYDVEEGEFRLTVSCGSDVCEYWIDPEVLCVRRLRRLDVRGEVLFEGEGRDIIEEEGVSIPRRISMLFPQSHRRVAVYYDRIVVNPDEISFAYNVPSSARKEMR